MKDIFSVTSKPRPGQLIIENGAANTTLQRYFDDIEQRVNQLALTLVSLGTITSGTVTLDMSRKPMKTYVNDGAHELAPGVNPGRAIIDIINGVSAGGITTSAWTQVVGDPFTTTNGHAFRCEASNSEAGSLLNVIAMQ